MSTMTQPMSLQNKPAISLLRDYAELMKARVTTLIVMTAWCGYYFGAQKAGVSSLSWGLFHALFGIGLVSSGTAALNEVMEYKVDGHMRRTAQRPLPTGRMSLLHATTAGLFATLGGLDTLVFAGGIGENAPPIRARICEGLGFLGIELSESRNTATAAVISTDTSRVTVRVIRTDEDLMIARSVYRILEAGAVNK